MVQRRSHWVAIVALSMSFSAWSAAAQQSAPAPAAGAPGAPATAGAASTAFARTELETLLKPIALYPDALLAQVLPAAAAPLDIVQASRWLDRNKDAVDKKDFSGADGQGWDPAVTSLIRFPEIIRKMNADLDWTSDLGDAFVYQPQDVAAVVQALRTEAEKTGALKTTQQQKVVRRTEGATEVIIIEPADPEIVYVPQYDPVTVYQPGVSTAVVSGVIGFGAGVLVGSLMNNNYWNWGSGSVYPPVWPGYPGYRPGGNVNIGNDININRPSFGGGNNIGSGNNIGNGIGNGSNIIGNTKPWSPNPDRYRPGMGTKAALARPATRPAALDRPGGMGGGDRPTMGGMNRPDMGGGNRPNMGGMDRPNMGAMNRPGQGGAGQLQRPATRPAGMERPVNAFGGADMGRGAAALGNRGAASRAQMAGGGRPGGGAAMQRGGGGRPAMGGGGGGGGRAGMGGGGGGGGGGRRGR